MAEDGFGRYVGEMDKGCFEGDAVSRGRYY